MMALKISCVSSITLKILEHILREFQIKKKCYSNGALGSPTCAELGLSQTTTVGLLYPGGDKSKEGPLH